MKKIPYFLQIRLSLQVDSAITDSYVKKKLIGENGLICEPTDKLILTDSLSSFL